MQSVCSYPQFATRKRRIDTDNPVEMLSMSLWPRWHIIGLAQALNVPYNLARRWVDNSRKMPPRQYQRLLKIFEDRLEMISQLLIMVKAHPETYVSKSARCNPVTKAHVARSKGLAPHPDPRVREGVSAVL